MGRSKTFVSKPKSHHRRWLVPVGVVVGALAAGVTAGPVQAASEYTVPIPLHPIAADVHLIGASAVGVAVQQDAPEGVDPVYTGPLGGELALRKAVVPNVAAGAGLTTFTVAGSTMAWYESMQWPGSQPHTGHALNLLTGKDVVNPTVMARPGAFNGESWFSDAVLRVSDLPGNWQRPLRRYRADGTTEILIPNVSGVVGVGLTADSTGVLRATHSSEKYALDLVTLKTGKVTRITEGGAEIAGVALSADTLVWVTKTAGGGFTINQKPRAGGAVTTYQEDAEKADVAGVVVGAGGVAYLIDLPVDPENPYAVSTSVAIVKGSTAQHIELPYDASGLAAVGDSFLTASSGYYGRVKFASGNAGVYRITEDAFTRVATIPPVSLRPEHMSLSAGRLRYSDRSGPDLPDYPVSPGRPVFERAVSPDRRAKFSGENEIARTSDEMVFSAGRGVAGVPGSNGTWQLIDRGQETGGIEGPGTPNVSGPYTLLAGKIYRPDGERAYTEPVPAGTTSGEDDLFGSKVVYVRTAATGTSTIWVDNAERSAPTAVATTSDAGCEGSQPKVSIWGEWVAWTDSCGSKSFAKNLRTGSTRQTANGARKFFSLSEGTLTFGGEDVYSKVRVMDLTTGNAAPVELSGSTSMIAVDDHQVARFSGTSPFEVLHWPELSALPFQPKYRPRLIGDYSPRAFSPNGDGQRDVWNPQFDLTKPMRSVSLKITNAAGTSTVAQLDGTAPDGSVRDLTWKGLSSKGAQLPTGLYRWTLTGRSADGDGTLVNSDGTETVSGTVELSQ